ncbi:hypothetical protein [Enteractinococcus coprophilus]|uniref:hypothetical protein n=1 Tax=Enteractinococcus coprophilus TaxID=1027633 RepID=UPI001FECDECD|nr:hypothetical protein [Enteractinococcus coprophilus]
MTDLQVTRTFYELAFGWEFNDYGPNYTGIKSVDGDSEVGGRRFEFTDPSGNRLGVYAAR